MKIKLSPVRIQRRIRLLNNIMVYLIALSIVSLFLYFMYRDMSYAYQSIVLILPFFYVYLLRELIKNPWMFLISVCITAFFPVPFISHVFQFAAYLATAILLVGVTFYLKLRTDMLRPKNIPLTGILVFAAVQLICFLLGYHSLTLYVLILALLFLVLHYCNLYQMNYLRFIDETSGNVHVPFAQIKSSQFWLVGSFFLVALCLMLGSFRIPADRLSQQFGSAAVHAIRFFFDLFPKSGDADRTDIVIDSSLPSNPLISNIQSNEGETALFWVILQEILKYALIIGAVLACIFLVYYIITHYLTLFYKNNVLDTDQVEILSPLEKKERISKPSETVKERMVHFLRPNMNLRVRKTFQHFIQDSLPKQEIISPSLTPAELSEHAAKDTGCPEAEELTSCYEKARYSGLECSREDAVRAKKLSELLKKRH